MAMGGYTPESPESTLDGENAPIMAEINITPLTDIFLVLLIIFMVTSSVMSQLGVDVDLPTASQSTSSAQPDGTIVSLLPEGAMLVNGKKVMAGDWDAFGNELRSAFKSVKTKWVILEGDRKAFLGAAVEVMDQARKAGAEGFAIATAPGTATSK